MTKKYYLISALLIFSVFYSGKIFSQIGIGTPNPSKYAALDIRPTGDYAKGLLIPNITTSERLALDNNHDLFNSILVFDKGLNTYFYWDSTATTSQWKALLSVSASPEDADSLSEIEFYNLNLGKTLVVGSGEVINTLDIISIRGDFSASGDMHIGGNAEISGTTEIFGATTISNTLTVNNTITSTGDITVTSTGSFDGYGTIPIGGIIMWSGNPNDIGTGDLDGWALCTGGSQNGVTIPDLQGRFILGSGGGFPNTGGNSTATLSMFNIPEHNHSISASGTTDNSGTHSHKFQGFEGIEGFGDAVLGWRNVVGENTDHDQNSGIDEDETMYPGGEHSHSLNITASTLDCLECLDTIQPFSIMPPYYTLAYIIRIK